MLTIFMEEGQYIMNKKKKGYLFIQFFFIVIVFFVIYLDKISEDLVEVKKSENVNLKEEMRKLEIDYAESVENDKKEEGMVIISKCISFFKEKQEKEKKIEELEREIKDYEQLKSYWNEQIAGLEK